MRFSQILFSFLSAVFIITLPTRGAVTATLITPSLAKQKITLVGIRSGQLEYFDANRTLQKIDVKNFVALRHISHGQSTPSDSPNASSGVMTLVDGERFPGHIAPSSGKEHLTWQTSIGTVRVTVDQIRSLVLVNTAPAIRSSALSSDRSSDRSSPSPNAPPTQDTIHLINGDSLAGFVASIDDKAVHIALKGSNKTVALPLKRVRSLVLANESKRPGKTAQLLTLTTGARILAQNISLDDRRLTFTSPLIDSGDKLIRLPANQLAAVDFFTSGYQMIPLTSLTRSVTSGGSVLGLRWPPRVVDGAMNIHAPVTIRVTLPDHTVRFAGDAALTLPQNMTKAQRQWANCTLTVSAAAGQAAVHLTAAHRASCMNLAIAGQHLTLSLTTAGAVPILDRVELTSAVILIKN